jgi:hypothetical protein
VPSPLTRDDIADIYQALGQQGRAALMRDPASQDRYELDTEAAGAVDGMDSLYAILGEIPNQDKLKHNDTCWQRHAACLRDRIKEALGWE